MGTLLRRLWSWMGSRNGVAEVRAALGRGATFRSKLSDAGAEEVGEMMDLMNAVDVRDLGLEPPASVSGISYVSIVETPEFHICLFLIGPSEHLPLHDHPDMTVLSRVIRGTLTVTSYDVVAEEGAKRFRAKRHPVDVISAPAETVALFPRLRNLHEFVAGVDGAVILDVIVPPYNDDTRLCTYYDVVDPSPGGGGDDDVILAPADPEPDFVCEPRSYAGMPP
mmetsp:Transcript_8729/g.22278  ORF Transcript_8729/g.22278 Transcript_8729/m.22278 type:complete len:223 (+) Transcript_8729:40-708(+)